jgi:superoxide dismutase, Cu-Zn family
MILRLAMVLLLAAAAAGPGAPAEVSHACAVLHPTAGSKVEGTIHFEKEGDEVEVTGRITGLSQGTHGFHIHTYGDCSAPDATSAGHHFNPAHQDHGGPRDQNRHLGDLGNLEAGADGVVNFRLTDSRISLGGPNSIVGRAVIVHARADDLKSQPAGESGARLACGVIGIAEP